jgi:proline iminopeptidase
MNITTIPRWAYWVVIFLLLAIAGYWLFGRSYTPAIRDANGKVVPGSTASLEKIKLGGVEQWLVIRGHDTSNPVLLFLSGGPGASELGRVRYFSEPLEQHFTMVVWEQRGCGKSFPSVNPKEDVTIEQYTKDIIELSEYLKERFNQEKIYLLGHSWGTIIGVRAAQARPDLFHAYIGAAQMVNVRETDQIIYRELLEYAQTSGDTKFASRLTELGEPPYFGKNPVMQYKDVLARDYGIFQAPHIKSQDYLQHGDLFARMLRSPEYTLIDKINFARGLMTTFNLVYPQLQDFDFRKDALEFDVPVYMILGRYDSNATPEMAEAYFNKLQAPLKRLYYFEDSGHDMIFQETGKFHDLMINTVLPETLHGESHFVY